MTNTPEEQLHRSAARASLLAERGISGREPLRFAAGLFHAQAAAAAAVLALHERGAALTGQPDDWSRAAEPLVSVLRFLAEGGPRSLRAVAAERARAPVEALTAWLGTAWARDGAHDFLGRAVLRSWAEVARFVGVALDGDRSEGGCPACGAPPAIAARRPAPGSDGAARFLCCSWCGNQWPITRVRCPSCGETDPDALPTWQTERYPGARVEACDRCRHYVKSIDLGVDGLAVPEVDELSSLALDVWAAEQEYTRIEPGLAGI